MGRGDTTGRASERLRPVADSQAEVYMREHAMILHFTAPIGDHINRYTGAQETPALVTAAP